MEEKKVDILLATYNGEKYVGEQIESILNQSYKNIRIIISDDCSKDNTPKILEEYQKKDDRIKVFIQPENLGVVKNIEFLLNQVESPLYMLADQDDVWLTEKVEKSVEKIQKENADLVFGDLEVVDQNLNTIYQSFGDFMLLNKKIEKYINSYKVNYLYNCVTGCTLISKKELLNYILPLPTNSKFLIHDHWIGLMAGIYGKISYMPEKYIKYRQHGNNQVGTNKLSHGFTKVEQVREHFINVKLGVFGTYVENNERFPQVIQDLNKKALNYFKMLQTKKNINFKGWTTFHALYKTESFSYYIQNFMIMNMPLLVKPFFGLRRKIKNIYKKNEEK